jgi:hypothetical protein
LARDRTQRRALLAAAALRLAGVPGGRCLRSRARADARGGH